MRFCYPIIRQKSNAGWRGPGTVRTYLLRGGCNIHIDACCPDTIDITIFVAIGRMTRMPRVPAADAAPTGPGDTRTMTSIQSIKGFKDILPGETELWQSIEKTATSVLGAFGFREIRLPILEKTELFARSIGETTDIVEKEMYTFTDRSGDLLTMRPEATAAVVRAYLQHKIYAQDPVQKYYTIGPMFRRERPQKGRYRQFYQIDAEVFGIESPYIDAQLIVMLSILLPARHPRAQSTWSMPQGGSTGWRWTWVL